MEFDSFFKLATGHYGAFDYQRRLACGDAKGRPDWLSEPDPGGCRSRLINIPTGLGKTAAVVLAWLWNRLQPRKPETENHAWPRRLVYCLPMRTLVEQTESEARKWLQNLRSKSDALGIGGESLVDLKWLIEHSPITLMGGEELDDARRDWDIYPEKPAILIGTQDMLLSRALNRGYGAGRARWPKDFALMNNDSLWVFDEVQLMSTGFATSLQFQAWRERNGTGPAVLTFSWWMSATLEKEWLASAADFSPRIEAAWKEVEKQKQSLWDEDVQVDSEAGKRLKDLLKAGTKLFHQEAAAQLKAVRVSAYIEKVAKAVKIKRQELHGETILIIVNTVERACALAEELKTEAPLLLHSRYRHQERKGWIAKLKTEKLIIATQVVEAGVDISSRVLFTELCPWPSFIQRCGRAARNPGEKADIYWLDVSKEPTPYSEGEMNTAKEELEKISDASLAGLRVHRSALEEDQASRLLPYWPRFIPRWQDLVEFFDTTPDLTGADVDISRFIRDGEEHDVSVFWRVVLHDENPTKDKSWNPEHAELCPVPVWGGSGFRAFMHKSQGRFWRWDYHDGWTRLHSDDSERIFPGQVFLLEQACGGYDPEKGWTSNAEDRNFETGPWRKTTAGSLVAKGFHENPAGSGDDTESSDGRSNSGQNGQWRTILAHSREVCEELENQLKSHLQKSPVDDDARIVLPLAARLHDWGKAHVAFKHKVKLEELKKAASEVPDGFPAKAPDHCWRRDQQKWQPEDTPEEQRDLRRAGFRHELASALAILELLRRHDSGHSTLAWPDAELRSSFKPPVESTEPLAETALSAEIAALNAAQLNLLIYLVAAHHGKVRMSLCSTADDLREDVPWRCPPDLKQARGVRDGDTLPSIALPAANYASAQVSAPAVNLRLDVMEVGLSFAFGPSWRERAEALLAQHRPFRLALYEALLRIADQRASKRAESNSPIA